MCLRNAYINKDFAIVPSKAVVIAISNSNLTKTDFKIQVLIGIK